MTGILRNMCCPSALDSCACMCHSVCSNNLDEKHTLLKEMGTRSLLKCKYMYLQNAIRHFSFGNCLLVLMVYIAKMAHKPCFLLC